MTFEKRLAEHARRFDETLAQRLRQLLTGAPEKLQEAVRYSALGGGKRFRPFLVHAAAALVCSVRANAADAVLPAAIERGTCDVAIAVELIHGYSLVHDDLPAMDDDDLRRGRPTCHRAYDEATAILVGDALQALAFQVIAECPCEFDKAEVVRLLAMAAGPVGMVGGQMCDLEAEAAEAATLDQVIRIQQLKTGALILFSLDGGALVAGADGETRKRLREFGEHLGLAFQIADDLLDAEGDAGVVGKATGKDARLGKATFPSLLGVKGAREHLSQLVDDAEKVLAPFGTCAGPLVQSMHFAARRNV